MLAIAMQGSMMSCLLTEKDKRVWAESILFNDEVMKIVKVSSQRQQQYKIHASPNRMI